MKLYRFMSFKEFSKMDSFIPIVGGHHNDCRTNSDGVCFFGEEVCKIVKTPSDAIAFLRGIVSEDILVEFDVPEECITKSYGIYADPFGDYYDEIEVIEYCTPQYSRDTFRPIRYGLIDNYSCTWYNYN